MMSCIRIACFIIVGSRVVVHRLTVEKDHVCISGVHLCLGSRSILHFVVLLVSLKEAWNLLPVMVACWTFLD